jgi:hypothetical protein
VSELKAEKNRLERAIAALAGANTGRAIPATIDGSRNSASSPRKHYLTAAGRKRLSVLMKKRWAEKRKKNSSGRKAWLQSRDGDRCLPKSAPWRPAARDLFVFYGAYRRFVPFPALDEELNLAPDRSEYHAKKLHKLGEYFFSFAPGEAPPRINSGRKLRTRMPPEFREKMSRIRKEYWRRPACPEDELVAAD